ncbi:MAG: hypothetical protein FWD59_08510 [Micrococcales bacterium]|nr:hypothetical protein [Micrococcales bacterium]
MLTKKVTVAATVAALGLVVSSVTILPTAVADPAAARRGVGGADGRPAGSKGVAGVREYRFVYVEPVKGAVERQVALPRPPQGLSYTMGTFFLAAQTPLETPPTQTPIPTPTWSSIPDGATPSGVLLRSDGKLVGYGAKGVELVAAFEARNPGKVVTDFVDDPFMKNPSSDYGTVLFSDGRMGALDPVRYDYLRKLRYPTGPEQFVSTLLGGSLVVRADGKVVFLTMGDIDLEPPVGFADFWHLYVDGGGFVAAARVQPDRETKVDGGYLCGLSPLRPDEDADMMPGLLLLVRVDGRVTCVKSAPYGPVLRTGGWSKASADPNVFPVKGPFFELVPKLARGKRYIDVWGGRVSAVFLRSDGVVVYRGDLRGVKCLSQPPKPPAGLRYVSFSQGSGFITSGGAPIGPWDPNLDRPSSVVRSDGRIVALKDTCKGTGTSKFPKAATPVAPRATKYYPSLPPIPNGWRIAGRTVVTGPLMRPFGPVTHHAVLIEKILPGDHVPSGIAVTKKAKPVKRGATAKAAVEVSSAARLSGGMVVVTTKSGKIVGRAKMKASAKVVVKINSRKLKARKTPQTLRVQYLGNTYTRPSGKATIRLKVTK